MWRLCDNIRDIINTCDGTFYNLSAYVCDCSLDAHKIMHPILSLKLGVTCFDANPPTFRGEGARSCETSPSALMNCFDANPPPFGAKGWGVAKRAPRHLWIALLRHEATKLYQIVVLRLDVFLPSQSHWASFMSLCFVCVYFWQHENFELLSDPCVHRDWKGCKRWSCPFQLVALPSCSFGGSNRFSPYAFRFFALRIFGGSRCFSP